MTQEVLKKNNSNSTEGDWNIGMRKLMTQISRSSGTRNVIDTRLVHAIFERIA